MTTYEYKELHLSYTFGVFERRDPEIAAEINREARDGWRLKEIIRPSKMLGQTQKLVAILEREMKSA